MILVRTAQDRNSLESLCRSSGERTCQGRGGREVWGGGVSHWWVSCVTRQPALRVGSLFGLLRVSRRRWASTSFMRRPGSPLPHWPLGPQGPAQSLSLVPGRMTGQRFSLLLPLAALEFLPTALQRTLKVREEARGCFRSKTMETETGVRIGVDFGSLKKLKLSGGPS